MFYTHFLDLTFPRCFPLLFQESGKQGGQSLSWPVPTTLEAQSVDNGNPKDIYIYILRIRGWMLDGVHDPQPHCLACIVRFFAGPVDT